MRHGLLSLSIILCAISLAHAEEVVAPQLQATLAKAMAGNADSQFQMGSAYDTGSGVRRDGAAAMRWYRLAADQGYADAQNSVGSGLQAEEKYVEARAWYEKAAAQHHALATNNLAYLYDLGLGVQQDRQKAFALYSSAAGLGWAEAMWNIAMMYSAGQLGQKDDLDACIWASRAQRYATPDNSRLLEAASKARAYFDRKLSPSDLTQCAARAGQWAPKSGTP